MGREARCAVVHKRGGGGGCIIVVRVRPAFIPDFITIGGSGGFGGEDRSPGPFLLRSEFPSGATRGGGGGGGRGANGGVFLLNKHDS